ncbi:MAG: TIGR01777 family oxidoreductase [Anaerolineales bacterium]|nr:TIGR01777 family oxidoreductase [Anaerolineales bacterium]
MRIIITGGTGLIGSKLAQDLIDNGYEDIILSRNPENAQGIPAGAQVVAWDSKTAAGWGHLADGAYGIVNLAGASLAGEGFFPTPWTDERKRLIVQSRLDAGKAVLEAIRAAENKPKVLVQSSAIGYYGPRGDENLDEQSRPTNDFLADVCQQWEAVTKPAEALGVRRVVIRTGVVLSMEGGAFTRLLLPFKLFAGGPMGNGQQYISWIHMADEINAIRFLLENETAQGAFNLTAPNPKRNREFAQVLGQIMKRPSFIPVPGFALRLMFGEVATVVVDGQKVHPERLQKLGFEYQFPQLKPALRDLLGK